MKNTSLKPYIYKVTNFETGQYYIGSQCSGKTVGVNYFTSSTNKAFKEDFKNHKEEKYKIEIIKEFTDPEECVRAENYMIWNHMQLKDGLCLNRACHCSNGEKIFSRLGQPAWNKGLHHSEESRKKISTSLKGISRSEVTKQKISEAQKGQSSWNKGISRSEVTKQKIRKALQGHPSSRQIKISIEGTAFNSLAMAAKYYNVSIPTIRNWAKNKKHNAVYIEKCPKI